MDTSGIVEGLLGKGNRSEGVEEKLNRANEEKEKGNGFFKSGDFPKALYHYHTAMMYFKGLVGLSPEETKKMNAVKLAVNNNMAAVLLKEEKYRRCVECCDTVLQIEPMNEKALFRRGKAHLALNNLDKAETDLTKAVELNPNDKMIRREMQILQQKMKKLEASSKKFYAGMFKKMSEEAAKEEEEETQKEGESESRGEDVKDV